ncbi:MAG: hypothetical protein V1752_03625 [Candidatus Firestonebacteria bacterium]
MLKIFKGVVINALILISLSCYINCAEVYVISDGYKVLPDGNIVEFNNHPPAKLKEGNAIWDKEKKEISVAGAKNEVIAFQVVIEGEAKKIDFECSDLSGASSFSKENISFHLVSYISFEDKFYPDIVIPFAIKGVAPFSIPYNISAVPSAPEQKAGVVMVEVKIPQDAVSGDYTGEINIKGGVKETLKLKLKVWDFTLPSAPSIVYDFNSYSSPVGVTGVSDDRNPYLPYSDEVIEIEHEFYRCANKHRAYLNILPVHSQRGTPRYTPVLSGKGKDVKCDWTNWDKRFEGVLNGSIFEDKEPVPYFYLPFNLHWPWGFSHNSSLTDHRNNWRAKPEYAKDHTKLINKEYLDEWEAVAKQYIEHFKEKGWNKTTYQVFLNHSDQENANSPWRLDEPYDRWGFQVLSYYAKLTHKVFENDSGINVKYRLDLGHFYCNTPTMQCYKAKKYDLSLSQGGGGAELLEPNVDLWYIGVTHSFGNREKINKVRTKDTAKEMFMYGGGQSLKDSAVVHRSLFWYLYDFKERGYCAWTEGCFNPLQPAKTEGSDHVWYSGRALGFNGPVPSLRMKLWRRGSFDAEYLLLAEKKSSRENVMKIFKQVCEYKKNDPDYRKVDFPYPDNNPEDYELARLNLASVILGTDISGGMKFKGRISGPPQKQVDQIKGY